MLSAVEFDDQPQFDTHEVGDVLTDRVLATKPEAAKSPISEESPQPSLGVG
jgi:hypothetical protein